MSVLTIPPNPEVFSKIPELEVALQECHAKKAQEFIDKVGKILSKHNLSEHFGICIVHRHFMMAPNEILVHAIRPDKSLGVSIPWTLNGNVAIPTDKNLLNSYDMGQYENKYVVPDNWFFNEDGSLVPFEFRATNETNPVLPSVEFSADLYKAVKEAGLERVLGVRSLANLYNSNGSWEFTPEGSKVNVTSYGKKLEGIGGDTMITVGFQYHKNGERKKESANCQGHTINCNHWNHCNHCYGFCNK